MSKLRVGIYYDLPLGGAERVIQGIVARLPASEFELFRLPYLTPSRSRIFRDFQNFVTTYLYARKLSQLVLAHKLDLILVSHDSFFAAPAVLKTSPVPTIFYCNAPTRALYEPELGIDKNWPVINRLYEHAYRFIKRKLEVNNARYATITLSNSRYTQNYLQTAYNISSSVVYPGVDTTIFHSSPDIAKDKSVLIVGNDEPQKRLTLAVASLSLLPRATRPLLHIVCPRSDPSPRLLNLAKRHGVRLKLHRSITNEELCLLYQRASVTLVTALSEPFGLSAAESLACWTPVIAVNQGGVGEIVEDGRSGYLCSPDPRDIAQKLGHLLRHKSLSRSMGQYGANYVDKTFAWAKTIKGVIRAVRSVSSSQ